MTSVFALCGNALATAQQIDAAAESNLSAVPESSIAILFGGLLWFLLLRKRA
ncbi:MAG: PEP-CTERM sorting domain-containing protein [Roseibacillus sp.]